MLDPKEVKIPVTSDNHLFPVFLKLEHMHVLIVGGGNIGLEKISAVLNNSPAAKITLVARKVLPEIIALKKKSDKLIILEKEFEISDLPGKGLVIAATGDRAISELIRAEATKQKILINVADTPDLCDFYLGSIVQKGDLKIAISTNGKSPTFAKRLKEVFNEELKEEELNKSIENLSKFRNHLKGDFANKVKKLNEITSVLIDKNEPARLSHANHSGGKSKRNFKDRLLMFVLYSLSALALMLVGHIVFTLIFH